MQDGANLLTTLNIFFRQAADNGHPGGAYNLVAAHFQGFKTDLQEHEIENMLKVAADGGHEEAKRALREMYPESYSYTS